LFEDEIKTGGGVVAARIISKCSKMGQEWREFPKEKIYSQNISG
jgi:hypothetical protein